MPLNLPVDSRSSLPTRRTSRDLRTPSIVLLLLVAAAAMLLAPSTLRAEERPADEAGQPSDAYFEAKTEFDLRMKAEKLPIGEDGEKVWARQEFNRARAVPGYEPRSFADYLAGRLTPEDESARIGDQPTRYDVWQNLMREMPVPETLPAKPEETGRVNQVFGSTWVSMGPRRVDNGQPTYPNGLPRLNVSGRIACVAVDPTDPDTIYIGAAQGGVWKTTDAGANWTPLTDGEASLAMGHIAIDPNDPDRIWAGTGERHFSLDSFAGMGLLFSDDAGATWTVRGTPTSVFGGRYISRVAVDRNDPDRVMVAASNNLWDTTDGYTSSAISRRSGEHSDIKQDPATATIWHAAQYGGQILRSTDNGINFSAVATAPTSTGGRIHLATHPGPGDTPSDSILYAVVVNSSSSITIYKSTDSGASWAAVAADPGEYNGGSQYWYDIYIAVSPTNPDHVAVGGVRSYVSTDGGASFSDVSDGENIHDDHHYGLWVEDGPTTYLYDANDGGLFRSSNQGGDWTSLNVGLQLLQFETLDISPDNEFLVIGGTQDNGTDMFNGTDVWTHVRGGDGGWTRFDPNDGSVVYGIYVRGHVYRSRNYGWEGTWAYVGGGLPNAGDAGEFNFYSPLEVNPNNSNMLLLGGDDLFRTVDQGDTWETTGTPFGPQNASRIAFAPSDGDICFVGANNGEIAVTTNFQEANAVDVVWTVIQDIGSSVTGITVHPTNPDIVYATTSSNGSSRVMFSSNATQVGASFSSVTSNLPSGVTPTSIVMDPTDPNTIYLGTEFGVFRTTNGGSSWANFSTGLPLMAMYDLRIDPANNLLVGGTHGRGAWRLSKPTVTVSNVVISNDRNNPPASNGAIDPGERADLTIELTNSGEEDATVPSLTLSSTTPGVTVHQNSATYSTLSAFGGAATNAVSFDFEIADGVTFTPGDTLEFELTLSANSTAYERTLPLEIRVGVPTTSTLLDADFESGTDGFTTVLDTGTDNWARVSTKANSGSFSMNGPDTAPANLATMTSPAVVIPAAQEDVVLRFWQTRYFEGGNWDGGVMEVSMNGGTWTDINDAGANVLLIENGVDGQLQDFTPLGSGRFGWLNGASGLPWEETVIHFDPGVWSGQQMEVRWRVASDDFSHPPLPSGWWIDDVSIVSRTWSSIVPVTVTGFMVD